MNPGATDAPGFDPGVLRRAARWRAPEVLFWALPVLAYFLFPDDLALLSQIAITALLALSLDLILGFAGIISLGQAAFFGIGAYTAALLAQHGGTDPLAGLALAALASAGAGLLTSFLVLRGADLTRLLVTLGIGLMLYVAANQMTGLTGGLDGLQGLQFGPLLGLFSFDLYGRVAYVYSVAVLFALFWLARRLAHAPLGLCLRALRQNPQRLPALGVPVHARLVAVYTLGALYAGVAGALLTQTTQFVSVDVFSFTRSAELLLMLVFGGAGSLYGAMLGALVFMLAQNLLSGMNPQYWQFWMGLALIVVVLWARGGIMGGLRALGARLARVRR